MRLAGFIIFVSTVVRITAAAMQSPEASSRSSALTEGASDESVTYLEETMVGGSDHGPALMQAVRGGQAALVEALIEAGAEINYSDNRGWTALHEASREGHSGIVELLITRGANMYKDDSKRLFPIMIAARHGHAEIVRSLVETHQATAYCVVQALIFAAFNGHTEIVKYLIHRDPSSVHSMNWQGFKPNELSAEPVNAFTEFPVGAYFWSVLSLAAYRGHLNVVSLLVAKGARVNVFASDEFPPLNAACAGGYAHVVDFLIKSKANVNADVFDGFFPIYFAASYNHVPVVELLIQRGANRKSIGQALTYSQGNSDVIEALLRTGIDPDFCASSFENTPLYYAAQSNRADIARLLIEHGASMNRADRHGVTPLAKAVSRNNFEVLSPFIENGAVVDFDLSVIPPSMNPSIVRALVLAGANIKGADNQLVEKIIACAGPEAMGMPHVESSIALAFKGIADLNIPDWTDSRSRLVRSIVSVLIDLKCSDLNLLYIVAPFLAKADEDMLKRTEAALKFLAGSNTDLMFSSENQATIRSITGPILNRMIHRSSQIGFRPVVKALYTIYWTKVKAMQDWPVRKLPRELMPSVEEFIHGPLGIYSGFEVRAMGGLKQMIARIRNSLPL